MENTISQSATTSLADDLISICLSGNEVLRSLHLDSVRFHTTSGVSGVPATASLRMQFTMPSPIIPSPMKPIFVMMMILYPMYGCYDGGCVRNLLSCISSRRACRDLGDSQRYVCWHFIYFFLAGTFLLQNSGI